MRIVYLVERPTQFEAPFFRYVAAQPGDDKLRVLFTAEDPGEPVEDPELGHQVDWGIDLLGGYDWQKLPVKGRHERLAKELQRDQCDLLITSGYKGRAVRDARELARTARIPTALRLDSVVDGSWAHRTVRRFRYRLVLTRRYDVFLAAGSTSLRFLNWCAIGRARRFLFPYAVDVEQFRIRSKISATERAEERKKRGVPIDDKVVLAVAKLSHREAPIDLIKAMRHLGREVWLLVAGDGPDSDDLKELARREAVDDRVKFLDYVPYLELPLLYAAADLFVHAARKERWGVSVAEALACGLPVITSSPVGAGHDLIRQRKNGFIYPFGEDRRLAAYIKRALKLDLDLVRETNAEILSRWDYPTTWEGLLEAARRAGARADRRQ